MNRIARIAVRYGLPVLILAVALAGAFVIVNDRPEAARKPATKAVPLVDTIEAQRIQKHRLIRTQGTVVAARELVLQPQVSGQIVQMHLNLVPGGLIAKDDVLFELDPLDYRLQLQESRAALRDAQARLQLEQGQQEIARREWQLFGGSNTPGQEQGALALRKPQLNQARASVQSARARVKQSQRNLERTSIKSPFNALVRTESLEVGRQVTTQTNAVTLVGTDTFWIQVNLPTERLADISIPGRGNGDETSSVAHIWQNTSALKPTHEGRAVRLLGELDPLGNMARALVEVRDPMGLQNPDKASTPLLLGSFVKVDIRSNTAQDVLEIPLTVLRDGGQVWVVDAQNTLRIRTVEVAWTEGQNAFLHAGIAPDDRLVTTHLSQPVEGMKLRIRPAQLTSLETQTTQTVSNGEVK